MTLGVRAASRCAQAHRGRAYGDQSTFPGTGHAFGVAWRQPRNPPLVRDHWDAWTERDRALLTQIARARDARDERGARVAAGELLGPYLPAVQALVAYRVAGLRLQPPDREEIVSIAVERLLRAVTREPELKGAPFGAVATTKVADAIVDFLRTSSRRAPERLVAPDAFPESQTRDIAKPLEQAIAVEALFAPLRLRERQIVYERHVLGLAADEVADRREMSTAAVKMTCSRSLRKLRDGARGGSVSFS